MGSGGARAELMVYNITNDNIIHKVYYKVSSSGHNLYIFKFPAKSFEN